MGQGWKQGENELGPAVEQLGDGNLVPKQPSDLLVGVPAQSPAIQAVSDVDINQLAADVAAIKVKLGM